MYFYIPGKFYLHSVIIEDFRQGGPNRPPLGIQSPFYPSTNRVKGRDKLPHISNLRTIGSILKKLEIRVYFEKKQLGSRKHLNEIILFAVPNNNPLTLNSGNHF